VVSASEHCSFAARTPLDRLWLAGILGLSCEMATSERMRNETVVYGGSFERETIVYGRFFERQRGNAALLERQSASMLREFRMMSIRSSGTNW
jgi:hypothetical protein